MPSVRSMEGYRYAMRIKANAVLNWTSAPAVGDAVWTRASMEWSGSRMSVLMNCVRGSVWGENRRGSSERMWKSAGRVIMASLPSRIGAKLDWDGR